MLDSIRDRNADIKTVFWEVMWRRMANTCGRHGKSWSIQAGAEVDKVAMGLVFLSEHFGFSKTNARSLGTFQKQWSFGNREALDIEVFQLAFRGRKQSFTWRNEKHSAGLFRPDEVQPRRLWTSITYFNTDVSWVVSMHRDNTTWLAIGLAAVSCYCADKISAQSSENDCWLSHFMPWDPLAMI